MTPEQLKQSPITVKPNQKLDTDEGESTKDKEEFTTSQELTEEHSTSDIHTETTEESKTYRNISSSYCIQQNNTS